MKSGQPLSLGVISLGCAKNLVDSEHMMTVLRGQGIALAPSPEKATIVLVNTCAFIRDAQEESIDAILDACALKKKGPCRAVIVAGCLPQRYRDDLQRSFPEVDAFVGLDELDRVADIARRVAGGERGILEVTAQSKRLFEPPADRILLTGGTYAYVKIAEGCNHRCAFCAIPLIRGRYRSRPMKAIVAEVESLLERGVREVNLISQDTTGYGLDCKTGGKLPELLHALGRIGGTFWIRLLYGYPARVNEALLDAIAATPQVCRYLDVPVQHSHPDVLRAMGRSETVRAVRRLPEVARERLPGVTLRTTCLVGHPGETGECFRHLLDYVQQAQFDRLGAFAFSAEEGTPAKAMPGQVAATVARSRRDMLMEVQQAIVQDHAAKLVGKREMVLVEKRASTQGVWIGRSARHAPEVDGEVHVSGLGSGEHAGSFVSVEYTAVDGYDMRAAKVTGAGRSR